MISENSAPFMVMDASAGSGKTRNLVKAVLAKALAAKTVEQSLKPIMAITFTNKAAAEMKERLLTYLIDFASPTPTETGLINELAEELELSASQITKRAQAVLKHILHHYNDLSFGTIDSFTSRLVRTFAKDLALTENFEIVLELNNLLQEAVNQVISEAGKDPELTNMLLQFVGQKLDNEKSWNLDGALLDVAKKILEENHREPLSRLRNFSAANLVEISKKLEQKSSKLLKQITAIGEEAVQLIEQNNLTESAFYYGKSGIFNYYKYLKVGNLEKCIAFNNNVTKTLEQDKWLGSKTTAEQAATIESLKEKLTHFAHSGQQLAAQHAPFITLAGLINKNMYALATMSALDSALATIEETQNVVPLAAFNHIINSKVKDQPVPFIYERLGERYKHFFIDEFQDTSKLQWENLLPLIENGVASTGSTLLVGDAKQSIYRWRGGEAEQFINLSNLAEKGAISSAIPARKFPLASNWRSKKTVVEFNNSLFTCIANHLQNPIYQNLYNTASQEVKKGDGGFVAVQTLPKENYTDLAIAETLAQIKQLRDEGFQYQDIVLLVRSNKHGALLVQELTTRNIPVISSDSLLLGNSYECQLLASLIALRTAPKNANYRWQIAHALQQMGYIKNDKNQFSAAQQLIKQSQKDVLDSLEKIIPGITEVIFAATDLYTFAAQLCHVLQLDGQDNAFTQAFLQAIHNYIEVENGNTFDFVSWWETDGMRKAISAPDQIDAVQITTIHKSKGLQYPVVIIPFVTWELRNKTREAWLPLNPEEFYGLTEMLVNLSSSNAEIIGGEYAAQYETLTEQEAFDSINMLYVACTRAENRLYMYGKKEDDKGYIFNWINTFLAQHKDCETSPDIFTWGTKIPPEKKTKPTAKQPHKRVPTSSWQSKVKMAISAPPGWAENAEDARTWGNKVHYILAQIKSAADVQNVLTQLHLQGTFTASEISRAKSLIQQIVTHPNLAHCFAAENTVFNERDILLPNKERVRPDRLVQLPNGNFALLDYKTGEPKKEHISQVEEYAHLLSKSGMSVTEKYLVYSTHQLTVKRVN